MTKGRQSGKGCWCRGKKRRVAGATSGRDTKERSTDVKSWGNKKVALILAREGGLIKARDNKRQEGSSGTREGRTAGSDERLKTPPCRHNGILSRHLRPFSLPCPPPSHSSFPIALVLLSFRGNSTYRACKQIRLHV